MTRILNSFVIIAFLLIAAFGIVSAADAGDDDLMLTPMTQNNSQVPPQGQTGNILPGQAGSQLLSQAAQLHDIYPPVELPSSRPAWFWPAVGAAMALIAGLLIYLIMRRRRGTPPPVPSSPEEQALAEIERIRTLYTESQYGRYAAALSGILRQYLESKFNLYSTRRTSSELLITLEKQNSTLFTHNKDLIINLLHQADMAKFARCQPAPESLTAFESGLIELINYKDSAPAMEEMQ